ncbi:MAG: DNA ligase D [Candidatus Saccharibacteria bacterium]
MGLGKYFKKRQFDKTPEPKGSVHAHAHKKLAFVVQEHHASSLHYDFRLELDGVLKSWAVPKGPSMNPHDHHLALRVEDHPYQYRTFEGVIPDGNYGAGNVIIWDQGTYEPRAETNDAQATLRRELEGGHLTFVLHGTKLQGEFALIKMHGQNMEDNAWLLIKKSDEFANEHDITKEDTSVVSHRTVDELGAANKVPDLSAYPKIAKPWAIQPMLCTLVDEPFDKPDWLYEIKWDGYRAISTKHGSDCTIHSRAGNDFSTHYPPILEALHSLKHDVILDGEIVVVDDTGSPHFEWLQTWRSESQGSLHYYVFDVLWCDGHDVRAMPLIERKALLKALIPHNSPIRYSDHVMQNGKKLFHEIEQRGLEGIVAKRSDSGYHEQERGDNWLKIKTHLRQEVVIGGFTEPRGSREYLGALIVGVYDHGELQYVGHSGGGIPDSQRKALRTQLDKLERETSPFAIEPKPNAPVHWVKPELVCEMNFAEWTSDGSMRQPKFVGMRIDKKPHLVKREILNKTTAKVRSHTFPQTVRKVPTITPKATEILPVEFTHLDKVFFPKHGYTKGDLIHYYESVADYILPYLQDRALSLLRQPGGVTDHGFFQKNMEHLPKWVPAADIFSDSHNGTLHWIVGGKLETLLYMVQLGCIEINPWNSRVQHLDKPDWLVIDLDPEGVTFNDVITVAHAVHEVCEELKITHLPKTSGKTGIHIYIPLQAKYDYEQAKNLAHLLVIEINKRVPKITSLERMPEKRPNKIYLDFLQNREGQTLASPYSVRPTPDANVATPLHWDEVRKGLKPSDFTIKNTAARLETVGDLWKPVLGKGVDIGVILKHLE